MRRPKPRPRPRLSLLAFALVRPATTGLDPRSAVEAVRTLKNAKQLLVESGWSPAQAHRDALKALQPPEPADGSTTEGELHDETCD